MTRKRKIILIILGAIIALTIAIVLILNNDKNPKNDLDRYIPGIKPRIPSSNKDNPAIKDIFTLNSQLFVIANKDTAYAVIDTLERGYIAGHFYPVIKNSNYSDPHQFNIKLSSRNTVVMLDNKKFELDIPARKLEEYLDGKRHNANYNNKRRVTLAIAPYYAPEFHITNDLRYKKKLYNVRVERNLHYATAKGFWSSMIDKNNEGAAEILRQSLQKIRKIKDLDLKMDIYRPIDSLNTPHPFLLFIHGGAFYISDKDDTTTTIICRHFASQGYITASLNYRMGFLPSRKEIERTAYMGLQDAHAAMRYVLAKDSLHLINPDQLFVGGSSAGSMIALNLAYMTNNDKPSIAMGKKRSQRFPDLGDIESSGNPYTNVFTFKAVANLWGSISDLNLMNGSNTDIISFHGDADQIVPFEYGYPFSNLSEQLGKRLLGKVYGSNAIHKYAARIGIRSELVTFAGLGHAPQFNADHTIHKENMQLILDKMTHFFYQSLVPIKPYIAPTHKNVREYAVAGGELSNIEWHIDGGFFTSINDSIVSVVWCNDAIIHSLSATVHHSSGLDFTVSYTPTNIDIKQELVS